MQRLAHKIVAALLGSRSPADELELIGGLNRARLVQRAPAVDHIYAGVLQGLDRSQIQTVHTDSLARDPQLSQTFHHLGDEVFCSRRWTHGEHVSIKAPESAAVSRRLALADQRRPFGGN